ncbi:creatinase-like [Tubulanus polymorphus]|uniref:creatinase-like n=1 Tax=Tubulanus polymorphus TaxID=672921 RepID=UPI003DA3BE3F
MALQLFLRNIRNLKPKTGVSFSALNRYTTSSQTADDSRPRLIATMKQGEKASVFSTTEIENRISKLRSNMSQNDIGGIVLTSYHNINYYTGGFLYCYFGRNYGLLVTQDQCLPICPSIDAGQPWRRSLIADNVVTYTDWQRDNYFHAVQNCLKDTKGKIGLEFDHVSLDNFKKFDKALPNGSEKVDIGEPTMRMRMVKSAEEIDVIKSGTAIAEIGGAAQIDALHEGVPEHEVALASTQAMIREIAHRYPQCEIMDTWSWFMSGVNTDGAHNPVTTRKVEKGDILSLNCFPNIAGYHMALERTLFLDHASDKHLELFEKNCAVHRRGLELIKPGVRCKDIALELNEMYRQFGLLQYRSFGYGHSFGSLSHYYGREAALELREDIETVLEPNMVISMEPMITVPEGEAGAGGYREHHIVVITETGADIVTKFPFGPEHNIIKK